ncbi:MULTISPECIES: hypothetical protein [Limnospira]|uniref:Uncharacterized protein n=2 Tax=Limnospira TaxID=2596745 RepID=A0A9P1KCN8_9CYAN|nr:hypothetical protein [Limnospira maxima]QJB24432.1 hypothetical protein HFV01_23420 [Limnospira fusiformis SAG 85.79]CDM93156.1 conserved protein of unknown function [Limnospira indica PCC 8005]
MSAAYQPISLQSTYDGSGQTFGFPNHGWLAVVASGSWFYFTPSVPRFNPRGVSPETGGGYRRYPHLCVVPFRYVKSCYELLQSVLTLGSLP